MQAADGGHEGSRSLGLRHCAKLHGEWLGVCCRPKTVPRFFANVWRVSAVFHSQSLTIVKVKNKKDVVMSVLDQEWQGWLDSNLRRGCNPGELYQRMRDNGFSVETIKTMMGDAYPEGIGSAPVNTAIDYAALSQTLALYGDAGRAQRFGSDLLQLYTLDNFLSAEECERIIALTESRLRPSLVTHDNGDKAFRTSMTCHLRESDDDFVRYVDEKISRTLGVRLPYSEAIQAQHYAVGQEFKAHHDYFAPDMDVYRDFTAEMGQRTWTFMVYLNDTEQGGGTHFLYPDHVFFPKQGQAVIWNNLHPDGVPNRHTLHHGMPVEAGKKVIITKWFRENGYGDMFHHPQRG